MPDPARPAVVALVRDLILGSRIAAAAGPLGVALRSTRDPAKLAGLPGERLLVDLNLPGAIEAAMAWKAESSGRQTIGFVSHVDADTARRAREGGIDRVLARSRFVERLPTLLAGSDPAGLEEAQGEKDERI